MKVRSVLLILFVMAVMPALAQITEARDQEVERILDEMVAQQDLDVNYAELYETVLHRLTSPININKASAEELRSLFILSEIQIQNLISHRAVNGELLSYLELQSIMSFSPDIIRRLRPLIIVEASESPSRVIRRIVTERNNYLITRYERMIEPKAGFSGAMDTLHRFRGSPDKWYTRFRVSHAGDFSLGFTLEKDPGEPSLTDYFSFHAQVANKGRLTNLIVGDFQAQLGQGLVYGGGLGMGKGAETITAIRRNSIGFMPYTSVRECGYFRGLATTISLARPIFIHALFSKVKPDAMLEADSSGTYIRSFQESGLHRNETEARSRNTNDEISHGLAIEYKKRAFQAGATFLTAKWSLPVRPAPAVYNRFEFAGSESANTGVFFNWTLANYNLFGEAAHTLNHGYGMVAGLLGSLAKNFDISILARRYDRDFQSLHANALSEGSSAQNESGIYWGWKYQASRSVVLSGYADLFTFPWMRYRAYTTAADGYEYLLRFLWKPIKTVNIFVQMKEETKVRNMGTSAIVYKTALATKRNYCINADYTLGSIGFKTRMQFSALDAGGRTNGFMLAQDVRFDFRNWGLYLRHALFDTDDFDNRQYIYEPDMWLAYSFPAYSGSGIRSVVMVRRKLSRHADIWIRWSRTLNSGIEAVGSGVDQINGPARNDLKVQARVRI